MTDKEKSDIDKLKKEDEEKTDQSAEKVAKKLEAIHREMTLDFSKLSSETTIEEVQKEALQVETDNLSAESPLDKYVRKHRQEVEDIKTSFGKDIDSLVSKERQLLNQEKTSEKEEIPKVVSEPVKSEDKSQGIEKESNQKVRLEDLKNQEESKSKIKVSQVEASPFETRSQVHVKKTKNQTIKTVKEEENKVIEGKLVDNSIFPAPTNSELQSTLAKSPQRFDSIDVTDSSEQDGEFVEIESPLSRSRRNSVGVNAQPLSTPEQEKVPKLKVEIQEEKKDSRKKILIFVVVILLLLFAFLIYLQTKTTKSSKNEPNISSSSSSVEKSDKAEAFVTSYNSFFMTDKHQALKNSNFDKLVDLEEKLKAIPETDPDYESLQNDYDNLTKDIQSIKAINAIFDEDVIKDGKLNKKVILKDGAKVPDLSSKNSSLDKLLKEAIKLAKSQQPVASSSSSSKDETTESSTTTESSKNTNTNENTAVPAEGTFSQNPNNVSVNNSGSRVPSQSINPNSEAFAWGPGILDLTISTMQSRGFISGNNYILLPIAVDTTGQGWYNIYNPDGSYLFSINCKTGFWAGTGGKHPDLGASFE
ncbi:MAG: cell division site-positioning protein MapZ family protein [Lactovum sp.]